MKTSKKSILFTILAIGIIAVLAAAYYVARVQPQQAFDAQNAPATIVRPEAGLEFTYLEGPDAFSLFEPSTVAEPLQSAFIIVPSPQFVALRNQEEIETPRSISLFVYDKRNAYDRPDENSPEGEDLSREGRLLRWAAENDSITGLSQAIAEPTEIDIDGVSGLTYQTVGTFPQTIYLVSYRDFIYFFVGQYETEGDAMQEAFSNLIDSIYFI
jgi:hypothetical protein